METGGEKGFREGWRGERGSEGSFKAEDTSFSFQSSASCLLGTFRVLSWVWEESGLRVAEKSVYEKPDYLSFLRSRLSIFRYLLFDVFLSWKEVRSIYSYLLISWNKYLFCSCTLFLLHSMRTALPWALTFGWPCFSFWTPWLLLISSISYIILILRLHFDLN